MSILSKESRLRILDAKLYKREKVNFLNFAKFLEREYKLKIDERTFERDIKALRERLSDRYDDDNTNILLKDRKHNTYKYEKGNFFAFEETALIKGNKIGKLLKYNRNFITDIDQELREQMDSLINEYLDDEEKKIAWNPVEFFNKENSGQKHFPELLKHILMQQAIKFTHTNIQKKTTKQKHVIPILLKEVDNGYGKLWFMLGKEFNDGDKEVTITIQSLKIFAIDRIDNISMYRPHIKINIEENFQPVDYFKYSFRGTNRENISNPNFGPEKVKLKILNDVTLKLIQRYPLLENQKVISHADDVYVEVFIETALDLQIFLFGHSDSIVVISPEHLKDKIKHLLTVANKHYGINN